MKTLQNNFTTPEQSKRLLELGVPADSADMYYKQYSEAVVYVGEVGDVPQPKTYYIHEPDLRHIYPEGTWTYKDGERINLSGKIVELRKTDIPCWSVGRLNEIFKICSDIHIEIYDLDLEGTQIERAIQAFENYAEYNWLDFSKLEE